MAQASEVSEVCDEEKSSKLKEISILCFGDSLTRGYLNYGLIHIPYSNTLQSLIETNYKNSIKLRMIESGVDGELVTNTMLKRISNILQHNSFDYVVFLGGTNDIGWQKSPKIICETLSKIYDLITNTYKCELFCVTIPPCIHSSVKIDKLRDEVNQFIRKQSNVVDLYQHIDEMSQQHKKQFFDKDGLHFSENGYAQFGRLVYNKIKPVFDQILSK